MQASELPVLKPGLTWRIDGDKAALIRGGKVLGTVEYSGNNTVYSVKGGARCSLNERHAMFAGLDLLYHLGFVTLGEVDDALQAAKGKVAA
jgi:hypothetical protein